MSLSQLSRLLPLPDDELKQMLDYAATLSKSEAVEHFAGLLGDSPDAIDFISSFNSRRQDPKKPQASPQPAPGPASQPQSSQSQNQAPSSIDAVPKWTKGPKKKKAALHTPAPRQVAQRGPAPGTAYTKKDLEVDDRYASRKPSPANTPGSSAPAAKPPPASATPPPPKLPPSAAGHLISDGPKPKTKSTPGSRSSTPAPKAKVTISGGTAMHGASTALSDLDAAIKALELSTNPTKNDDATRRCNCVAARHPLLAAAPNCLNCGKVICVKEGLGPCTSCGASLLTASEVQSMIRELREERGREKMAADRAAHKRAEVSKKPAPFSKPRDGPGEPSAAETKALEQRDRLLNFQAQNAQRTTLRDEAADFDVGTGGNIWSTPEERARELKRQQKVMREMEWHARPEYEKRRTVVSIDLVGGKAIRRMASVERPESPAEEIEVEEEPVLQDTTGNRRGGTSGTFSRNPLLGGLLKPVYDAKGKGAELEGRKDRTTRWRRVQDDQEDNSEVILNGGAYGGRSTMESSVPSTGDEPACG